MFSGVQNRKRREAKRVYAMHAQKTSGYKDKEKRISSTTLFVIPVFTNGMLAISLGLAAWVYAQVFPVNNFWRIINPEYGAEVAMVYEFAGYMLYLAFFGILLVIIAALLFFIKSFMAKVLSFINKTSKVEQLLSILLWVVPMAMILAVSVFCYIPISSFAIRY